MTALICTYLILNFPKNCCHLTLCLFFEIGLNTYMSSRVIVGDYITCVVV